MGKLCGVDRKGIVSVWVLVSFLLVWVFVFMRMVGDNGFVWVWRYI